MIISNKENIIKDRAECIINFINSSKNCVEPMELYFRDWFPMNYYSYITRGNSPIPNPLQYMNYNNPTTDIGGIYFDYDNNTRMYGKVIFNSVLYDYPRAVLDESRITFVIRNIITLAQFLNIKSVAIPIFESYNQNIQQKNIEYCIINMFDSIQDIELFLYV